uniref:Uncharacterized protein n=1 Tax=Thermogemmatispora argillosa TaxID=2045280 RepID=A0A455SZW9_9CHLR|nr:hypothetical protein KTA_13150 [Thermogemmatispora argillosa]
MRGQQPDPGRPALSPVVSQGTADATLKAAGAGRAEASVGARLASPASQHSDTGPAQEAGGGSSARLRLAHLGSAAQGRQDLLHIPGVE